MIRVLSVLSLFILSPTVLRVAAVLPSLECQNFLDEMKTSSLQYANQQERQIPLRVAVGAGRYNDESSSKVSMLLPDEMDVILHGISRRFKKLKTQGTNSVVYTVGGNGWPNGQGTEAAVGKTHEYRDQVYQLIREAPLTAKVGQLIDCGEATNEKNRVWLIMKDMSATKTPFQMDLLLKLYDNQRSNEACLAAIDKAVDVTVTAIFKHIEAEGLEHGDHNPGNVFFNKDITEAELIDWANAKEDVSLPDDRAPKTKSVAKVFHDWLDRLCPTN